MGSLAGACLPQIVAIVFTLTTLFDEYGNPDLRGFLFALVAPLIVTLPIVLTSSVVIGLPTSWVLKRYDAEQLHTYVFVGVAAGSLIPLLIYWAMGADKEWWLSLLGAFSGGVTAASWFNSIGPPEDDFSFTSPRT